VNPANQKAILKDNCNIIHTIIKLLIITRDIILLPKNDTESLGCVSSIDAATDCVIGCLKLLLNLTYDHHGACESVRLASTTTPKNSNKGDKRDKRNKRDKRDKRTTVSSETNSNVDTEMETTDPLSGLSVLLSLLNIQFHEDMFDIHQHVVGLLINLV